MLQLIYRSHSLISSGQRRTGLGEIFATARLNNRRLDVTGALMISDGAFVQVLEGDDGVVRELYATISGDPRHQNVTLLDERPIDDRAFGRWAMAQVGADGSADIRLMSNTAKGVIVSVRGDEPPATAEQETVLAFMRESLALV
ncbi:BLUF domain-containing protein [Conexibacter woesei]|uniref:BLUF domain-containing protein n=1 Tax=Conexibacter woesei TaxID=191495 RepID=UPI0004003360|nr:BLUF domain-containing protein [Conexibacter woesei]